MGNVNGSSFLIGLVLLLLLVLSQFPVPNSSAHVGSPLSAWTYSPPTIDGTINPAEWGSAASVPYTTDGGISGVFYVMNDAANLYIALTTTDPTLSTGTSVVDTVFLYFDNNNNGAGPESGDDIIGWQGYESEGFRDGFSDGTYSWQRDTDYGGISDGAAAATNDGTHNLFEITHPLNTADNAHDFSLSLGSSVGFALRLTVDSYDRGWWSSNNPSQWQDIVVSSQPTLTPENVQAWYWTSHTYVNSVARGDVDGDGFVEIITSGEYDGGTGVVAQLCVWSGATLALENVKTWYWISNTYIESVLVTDVDYDGQVEIVTGGSYFDGTRNVAQLCVWNGATLTLENVKCWYWTGSTEITSVSVDNVDGDGSMEIVTGGDYYDGTRKVAQLCVWDAATLAFENVKTWYWTSTTLIRSVVVANVDGDGQVEIVTGGAYDDGTHWVAQLCVWNGATLALEDIKTWYWGSDAQIFSVAVGCVDGDYSMEIVTGGDYHDDIRFVAQLCVWDGATLALENVQTWYWTSGTSITSVVASDVDGDGSMEIVTGGYHHDGIRTVAQLCVWNGATLALENVRTWYWTSNTVIWSVAVGDVDGDVKTEIVTGGSTMIGYVDFAQLVVWA